MCSVDAPEPQTIEVEKPTFVRNPFLDELDNDARSADALRRGRSSLVIPMGESIGFTGRGGEGGRGGSGLPQGNSRRPIGRNGGSQPPPLHIDPGSLPGQSRFHRGGGVVNR